MLKTIYIRHAFTVVWFFAVTPLFKSWIGVNLVSGEADTTAPPFLVTTVLTMIDGSACISDIWLHVGRVGQSVVPSMFIYVNSCY